MPPAYAERVNAPAARFWLARKTGAPRVASETPELDESRSSRLALPTLLLRHGEASVSHAGARTSAGRPRQERESRPSTRSHPQETSGAGSGGRELTPRACTFTKLGDQRVVPGNLKCDVHGPDHTTPRLGYIILAAIGSSVQATHREVASRCNPRPVVDIVRV